MAKKRMTFFDALVYKMMVGAIIEDDEGNDQIVNDVHVDISTRRITAKFNSGDCRNIGFNDVIDIDVDGVTTLTENHTGEEVQLKPNKKRLKNKKRK